MIFRLGTFLFILIAILSFAWFNPIEKPRDPQNSHFIKITHDGKPLPAWSGPWRCVLDNRTGLLWEVKSYAEDMQDKQCSFSWYDGITGNPDKGDCFIKGPGSDTMDLIAFANEKKICNIQGWRLPTKEELQSLLFKQPKAGAPLIEKEYFPYTYRSIYWTSNAHQPLKGFYKRFGEGATGINFLDGKVINLPYGNAAFVRLVAKPQEKPPFHIQMINK